MLLLTEDLDIYLPDANMSINTPRYVNVRHACKNLVVVGPTWGSVGLLS